MLSNRAVCPATTGTAALSIGKEKNLMEMDKNPEEKIPANTPEEIKSHPELPEVEPERRNFRALILANPNYFGNVKISKFKPVKTWISNTSYEELICVGFNPESEQLQAVVYIKKSAGYLGGLCNGGSPEFVRFYLSLDNGATWSDAGMVSFQAHDIPGDKPLEYAVTLPYEARRVFCRSPRFPLVRAILSWNNPPPPNQPDHTPVWGNVREAAVQAPLLRFFKIPDLLEAVKVKLPKEYLDLIDLEQAVPAVEPKPLPPVELAKLYRDKGVPEHRFLFKEVQQLMSKPSSTANLMAPDFPGMLPELEFDLGNLITSLLAADGDTRYEELTCIGLDPNEDFLVGVVKIKLPNGYSGGPCSAGSNEYVAFWVDWGDGAGWSYAGTAVVDAYDFSAIPPGGLHYAVHVPVDLSTRRKPCHQGAVTVKVRAILSWQAPPPPANPNWRPAWGNREETLVHIKAGPQIAIDDHTPYIDTVGNMAVCDIDPSTGLATGAGVIANFIADQSPFGGTITVTGFILNAPNVLGGAVPLRYRVWVRESGGVWQPLGNSFQISITQQNGVSSPIQFNQIQSVDSDGCYTYQEQLFPNQWRLVAGRVLARWITGRPMTGKWEIRMEAKLPDNSLVPVGIISCSDGTTRSQVAVRLDEDPPAAAVSITGFTRGGGPLHPALPCGKFLPGDIIHGSYAAGDEHFGRLVLSVEPAAPAHGAAPSPSQRSYPIVPTTGESGSWSLDTSGMDPCGYIVRLWVRDRTIVNSGSIGWHSSDSVGFCLEAPQE